MHERICMTSHVYITKMCKSLQMCMYAPELDETVSQRQRHEVARLVVLVSRVEQNALLIQRLEVHLDAQLAIGVMQLVQSQVRLAGERRHDVVHGCNDDAMTSV